MYDDDDDDDDDEEKEDKNAAISVISRNFLNKLYQIDLEHGKNTEILLTWPIQ